ncbi:Hsp70 protein-domain-containing protein [Coemansia spiralis]|nr:Hsp70 protein-domain-containing protein [Coemansia spiralis]
MTSLTASLLPQKRRQRRETSISIWRALSVSLLVLLCILLPGANAAVLGIDYGTEWFTIAMANPGRPLDLVLNRDANRQTASVVTVNGLERTFGSNAMSIAPRLPENTFISVRNLLGVSYDSDVAAAYRKQFPNRMLKEPTMGTVSFGYGSQANETLIVQEIVAMQLRYARQLVKESEGISVKDVVLTVPSFFDRSQRQAMLDAANLAGFRTIALVNDGSAVALNYAMNKAFTEPEKHLFYDMGAGKTVATVASFSTRQASKHSKSKKSTIINVQSFAADSTLGGQGIDFIVREMLIARFVGSTSSSASDVRNNARAMNRLLKEAKRVKTILSANVEAIASVEGLYKGDDLRAKLTRNELEQAISHLSSRIRAPIDSALESANYTIADIDSIVLVGGGSRVPFVQKTLSDIFGSDKLSRNVNAEEACVLGAVFKGATLSSQFRVRDMRLRDAMPYAVRGTYSTESKSLLGSAKEETAHLYRDFAAVGARRVIRDIRSSDFTIEFELKDSGSGDSWVRLATAKISGVSNASKKLKAKNVLSEKPEVKTTVQTNELSEFEVIKAEAFFNVTNPGYTQYIEDLAAWEKESASIQEEAEVETAASDSNTDSNADSKEKTKKKSTLRPRPTAQPEIITEVVKLDLDVEHHGLIKMSNEALKQSRNLLKRMDDDDSARIAHHGAVNQLESLIYHLRDISDEEDVIAVTSEGQRKVLEKAINSASDWLENSAEEAPIEDIEQQIATLKELESPISYRKTQNSKRTEHIESLKSILSHGEGLVAMYHKEYTLEELEPIITYLQGLEDILDSTSQWLDAMVTQQGTLSLHEDPILTTTDMDSKALEIERALATLVAQNIQRIQDVKATESAQAQDNQSSTVDEEPAPQESASTDKRDGADHDEL